MADAPDDTQAQRRPAGKPERAGLANTPRDTATGTIKPQDGPMDRAGTHAPVTPALTGILLAGATAAAASLLARSDQP